MSIKKTSKQIFRYAAFLIIATLALYGTNFAFAQITPESQSEINKLNKSIEEKNTEIKQLTERSKQIQQQIEEQQNERISLQNQLALIENRIKKNEIDVNRNQQEIEKINLAIEYVQEQIGQTESTITIQEAQLATLLRDINREDQRSQLEVLFLNKNLSDFITYVKHLDDVQSGVQRTLVSVKEEKRSLEVHEYELELNKAQLDDAKLQLEINQEKLEEEKAAQERLVNDAESSQFNFERELSQIRSQQRESEQSVQSIQQEIAKKLQIAQQQNPSFSTVPGKLLYPVPNQGIVTYFHDPTYPYKNIVGEHSGLDFRTLINGTPSMGLTVRAAGDGVVGRVIKNGRYTGNAVYLYHNDGSLVSIYLHLSVIKVTLDQVVSAGDAIGLSGGAPGDPGAGLSNGPHLHFEVRKDGIPVDPCTYLNPAC